jgi:hypothetical protein
MRVSSQYFGATLQEASMCTPEVVTNLPEVPLVTGKGNTELHRG